MAVSVKTTKSVFFLTWENTDNLLLMASNKKKDNLMCFVFFFRGLSLGILPLKIKPHRNELSVCCTPINILRNKMLVLFVKVFVIRKKSLYFSVIYCL